MDFVLDLLCLKYLCYFKVGIHLGQLEIRMKFGRKVRTGELVFSSVGATGMYGSSHGEQEGERLEPRTIHRAVVSVPAI